MADEPADRVMDDLPAQAGTTLAIRPKSEEEGGGGEPPKNSKCPKCGRTHLGECDVAACTRCGTTHRRGARWCNRCGRCAMHKPGHPHLRSTGTGGQRGFPVGGVNTVNGVNMTFNGAVDAAAVSGVVANAVQGALGAQASKNARKKKRAQKKKEKEAGPGGDQKPPKNEDPAPGADGAGAAGAAATTTAG